jgi:hypothetical protein
MKEELKFLVRNKFMYVKVVYDTFTHTTIRAVRCDSLLERLRLCTLEQDEHRDLHGSDCRSVILYVYGRELYCCVCDAI